MLSLSFFVFVAFLMLSLGAIIFVHDPKSRLHQLFLLWVLFIVVWMVTNYLENVTTFLLPIRELFLRTDFATGLLASGFLLLFTFQFINPNTPLRKKILFFIPAVILAGLSFTPWHLTHVYLAPTGEINFDEGEVVFPLYALALIFYFVYSCILLWIYRHRSKGPVRAQATTVAIGLLFTTIGTLGINLFLQNVLPVELFRFGIYSMLFFEIAVAYSILRHEFLRIQLVVIELLLMAILATLLTRTILSNGPIDAIVSFVSFAVMLILGFAMVRSFLNEARQKEELAVLSADLEQANKKLSSANLRLQELDVLKTEFLSIASHQLRTPLAVMKGYVSTLTSGMLGKVNKKQSDALNTVSISTEQLIVLVNHLLDLTRIESGKLAVKLSAVDMNAVVDWIVHFLEPRAKEKSLKLVCEKPRTKVLANVDLEKVKEIVMNLTDNAIKYTAKGSVTVTLSKTAKEAVVEVRDTGYGMTEKDLRHLFEKFARGSASAHANMSSGLGLYVCKKLAEAMGGTVSADSEGPEKGSTFTLRVPLAR